MESHFINSLNIKNFKSIKELKLNDFNRINLFIGKPNVGKSNILEAISSMSIPIILSKNSHFKINELIRVEETIQMFYDDNIEEPCEIIFRKRNDSSTEYGCRIDFIKSGLKCVYFSKRIFDTEQYNTITYTYNHEFILENVKGRLLEIFNDFKRYIFKRLYDKYDDKTPFLLPPFGGNLLYTLEINPKLKKEFSDWFKAYGLRLVFDKTSNTLKILKDKGEEIVILPYSLIADTLQRIIFYKTAVASNDKSILTFEEPEAHSFPPYISEFTQEVIRSKTNQFFLATHSPIVVNDFLENAREDLSIFMVNFKNGQTVAKQLSRNEIEEIYTNGVDLFFNYEDYSA